MSMTHGQPHIPTPEVVDPHTLEELGRDQHRGHFAQPNQHQQSGSPLGRALSWPFRRAFRLATWPFRRALSAFLD